MITFPSSSSGSPTSLTTTVLTSVQFQQTRFDVQLKQSPAWWQDVSEVL